MVSVGSLMIYNLYILFVFSTVIIKVNKYYAKHKRGSIGRVNNGILCDLCAFFASLR